MFIPAEPLSLPYTAVLIPVGNHGYTFGPEEAVAYLRELNWTGITVPVHYEGRLNPETAAQFAQQVANTAEVHILAHGEALNF